MKNQKGIAFLTMVILLGVIALICAGLSVVIVNDAYTVRKIKNSKQAYFLAEAGAERAIQELYDHNFDFSEVPSTEVELGDGTYKVTLNQNGNLVSIQSEGKVKGVLRTVRVLVRRREYEAFRYTIANNGYTSVYAGSKVIGDIRANATGQNAVYVAETGIVEGDIYACGDIEVWETAEVKGNLYSSSPAIDMPPFDASFFDYYKNLADGSDDYIDGDHTFPSGTYTPGNGVIYVNGDVTIDGDVIINGCLVAKGSIFVQAWLQSFIQHQTGNLPALMSIEGDIWIETTATLNGLIYTKGYFFSAPSYEERLTINGSMISGIDTAPYHNTTVNFVHQNPPPGLSAPAAPLEVVCWSG